MGTAPGGLSSPTRLAPLWIKKMPLLISVGARAYAVELTMLPDQFLWIVAKAVLKQRKKGSWRRRC